MRVDLLLLLASRLVTTALGVEVGDEICVEGYIMDVLCIDIGRLLDNWSLKTLERPGEHTVHCLADVGACIRSGFEVLLDPSAGERTYSRGWRLDDAGTEQVVKLARSVGHCSTCTGEGSLRKGFRAAVTASILNLGSSNRPPLIKVNTTTALLGGARGCALAPDDTNVLRPSGR